MEQIIKDILEKHIGTYHLSLAPEFASNLNNAIIDICEAQIEMCAKNVPWEETPINNSPNIATPQHGTDK